jgi:hypothetical protein
LEKNQSNFEFPPPTVRINKEFRTKVRELADAMQFIALEGIFFTENTVIVIFSYGAAMAKLNGFFRLGL